MSKSSVLNLSVAPGDARPIFKQIVDGVRMQIIQGQLAKGAKLPSVRGLAMQLTINVNTVAKAYTALTAEGLLEARPGLGLFVAEPRQLLSDQEQEKRLESAIGALVNEVASLDFSKNEILTQIEKALNKIEKFNDKKPVNGKAGTDKEEAAK